MRLISWSLSKPWITFDKIRTNSNVTITITIPVYNHKEFWLHSHVRWRMTVGNSQCNWTIWVRIYTVMKCSFSWPAVEGVALGREIRPWYSKFTGQTFKNNKQGISLERVLSRNWPCFPPVLLKTVRMGTYSFLGKGSLFFYTSVTNAKANYMSDTLLQNIIPARLPKIFTAFYGTPKFHWNIRECDAYQKADELISIRLWRWCSFWYMASFLRPLIQIKFHFKIKLGHLPHNLRAALTFQNRASHI